MDADLTYAKIINVGNQVVVNRIDGYLQSRIAFYLMNLHLAPRAIYLTRVRSIISLLSDVSSDKHVLSAARRIFIQS